MLRRGRLQRKLKTMLIFNVLCVIYFLLTEILTTFQIQINCKSYEIKVGNCANFYKNTNSNYKSSNQASSKKEWLDKLVNLFLTGLIWLRFERTIRIKNTGSTPNQV